MKNVVIYIFPLLIDLIVSLILFATRHSLAERGMGTTVIGAIPFIYGVVYILSSLFMGKIVKPNLAKKQMIASTVLITILLALMGGTSRITFMLMITACVPFATSLFFNSFQSFMLHTESDAGKHLSRTVGNYTFAWSLGFAAGPLLSSVIKANFSWSATYYIGSLAALTVGLIAICFKPDENRKNDRIDSEQNKCDEENNHDVALPYPAWFGLFIGLTAWIIFSNYWPVQAEIMRFSTYTRGGVEFAFAISQAFSALLLSFYLTWYHKPALLPFLALPGCAGVLIFAFAKEPIQFVFGASLCGIYTGSCFIYMVYHAMFDKDKAVKRVAINEVIVGTCFIAAPLFATTFLNLSGNFKNAYILTAALMVIGISIQLTIAILKQKSGRKQLIMGQ